MDFPAARTASPRKLQNFPAVAALLACAVVGVLSWGSSQTIILWNSNVCRLYNYIYIHRYFYMHIHTHTHTHAYTYTYVHTYIHTYLPTYVRTYVHTYIHACMHACIHTYIQYVHACMHAYMHTYIHTVHACMHACIHTVHTCMHACMHACMHTYTHTQTFIHTYIFTYTHTYKFVYIYTHMYIYIYIHTHIYKDIHMYIYIYIFYMYQIPSTTNINPWSMFGILFYCWWRGKLFAFWFLLVVRAAACIIQRFDVHIWTPRIWGLETDKSGLHDPFFFLGLPVRSCWSFLDYRGMHLQQHRRKKFGPTKPGVTSRVTFDRLFGIFIDGDLAKW